MASPGNPSGQHCASCIGTLSLQITRFFSLLFAVDGRVLAICRSDAARRWRRRRMFYECSTICVVCPG